MQTTVAWNGVVFRKAKRIFGRSHVFYRDSEVFSYHIAPSGRIAPKERMRVRL